MVTLLFKCPCECITFFCRQILYKVTPSRLFKMADNDAIIWRHCSPWKLLPRVTNPTTSRTAILNSGRGSCWKKLFAHAYSRVVGSCRHVVWPLAPYSLFWYHVVVYSSTRSTLTNLHHTIISTSANLSDVWVLSANRSRPTLTMAGYVTLLLSVLFLKVVVIVVVWIMLLL